ncbi:hypothetical protein IGI04_019335 [Brassica rapa subsp. trilocularis]|uniref:Uncharacterized protein n=1 Tax=Brassica rapa subsp. trilocularis TaxID=1813537 RepID=A0ABQ7MIZ7_BRACM|nr:hypothetical protein IGI04_019335 [Brassica rapa subsp. trilocularis]
MKHHQPSANHKTSHRLQYQAYILAFHSSQLAPLELIHTHNLRSLKISYGIRASSKLSPCRLKQEEAVCSIRLFNTSRGRRVHPGVQKLSAAVPHHPMSPLKKEDPRKQRQWSGLATLSNKASSGFLLFKVQEEVSQEESLLLVLVWRVQHGERWELRHGGSKGKVHGRWRRWSAH